MSSCRDTWEELGDLASLLCEGQITPEQAARLEELAHSPQAKRYLLHYLQLHGELYWENAVTLRDHPPAGLESAEPGLGLAEPDLGLADSGLGATAGLSSSVDTGAGSPGDAATTAGTTAHLPTSAAGNVGQAGQGPSSPRPRVSVSPPHRWRWQVAAAVAASLLVGMGWWLTARHHAVMMATAGRPSSAPATREPSPTPVARLSRLVAAEWTDVGPSRREGAALAAGETLPLADGLAEVSFDHGAKMILRGPATFQIQSADGGLLREGCLTARVGPKSAGFTVRTPDATVVDLGTEFGVAVPQSGPSQVEVFVGQVLVHPSPHAIRPRHPSTSSGWRTVGQGQAVRICRASDGQAAAIEAIEPGTLRMARHLPSPGAGAVADLRRLVGGNPHLIHHYTFEGATLDQQRQDRRGNLPLTETVMKGGRGGGQLGYAAEGFDATTQSIAPYRSSRLGDDCGIALETETTFQPPPAMTLELLVNFAGFSGEDRSPIAAAVATRADERRCGFLLAVVGDGQLTHLMDSQAPWVEADSSRAGADSSRADAEPGRVGPDAAGSGIGVPSAGGFSLIPGDWYYVASTFHVVSGKTLISTYVADLSRGERTLSQVVKDQWAAGVPATSRLGIGKGFDADTAHAYPWSGRLDEIAIYDAVLSPAALAEHLRALAGTGRPSR